MIKSTQKILTENPYEEIWKRLSIFKDDELINKSIRKNFGLKDKKHLSDTKKQAKQIRFSIKQSEGYFKAAKQSGIEVKPNLLYYGMLSLGTALFLFKSDGNYSLDAIRKKKEKDHGLRPKENFSSLPKSEKNLKNILSMIEAEIYIKANQPIGTFKYFYDSLVPESVLVHRKIIESNKTGYLKRDFALHNADKPEIKNLLDKKFSLDMLFSYLPDMVDFLNNFGIPSRLFFGDIQSTINITKKEKNGEQKENIIEKQEISINRLIEENKKYFKKLYLKNHQIKLESEFSNNLYFTFDSSREKKEGHLDYFPDTTQDIFGQIYFIYKPEDYILEPANYYICMYVLSMLCRYYPDVWMKLLEENVSFRIAIDSFCNSALRKFPNLILNQLTGIIYNFCPQ
jgi:hypothetical protein